MGSATRESRAKGASGSVRNWTEVSGGAGVVRCFGSAGLVHDGRGEDSRLGKPVDLRLIPLILIIGGLALRTVLARQAERIRRGRG